MKLFPFPVPSIPVCTHAESEARQLQSAERRLKLRVRSEMSQADDTLSPRSRLYHPLILIPALVILAF